MQVFYPGGVHVDPAPLLAAARVNDDGAGFCVIVPATDEAPQRRVICRVLDGVPIEQVVSEFIRIREEHIGSPAVFFVRWSTAGARVMENVQPFPLRHGTLTATGHYFDAPGELSDAWLIAHTYQGEDITSEEVRNQLADRMTERASMVILAPDGRHWILGENTGHWMDGAWYSCTDHLPPGESDDPGWVEAIGSHRHRRQLYRTLGDAIWASPDLAAEINTLRGDILAVTPQLGRGIPDAHN